MLIHREIQSKLIQAWALTLGSLVLDHDFGDDWLSFQHFYICMMFFSVNLVRSFSFTLSPEVISWGVYFNLVLSDVKNVESQKVLSKKTQRSSIGFCASKSHGFPLQPIKITRTGPGSKATVIKSWTNKSLRLDEALSSPLDNFSR